MTILAHLAPWRPDLLAGAAVVAAAGAYTWAWRRLRSRGRRTRMAGPFRAVAFGAGLAVLAVALVSPLDHLSSELLSAHMVQHLLMVMVAAPLLVLGAPLVALSAAVPAAWRARWRRTTRRPAVAAVRAGATHPAVTWVAAVGVLWAWHLPALYQAALRSDLVHVLEHATLLGTASLFWWTALHPAGRRRLPRGADVLYVFAGGLQGGALGALLTFAADPIYPAYAAGAASRGIDPLVDQQLAGLLMWIPFGTVYLAAAAVLFVAWLRAEERAAAAREARAHAGLATAGGRRT